jgi:hypothetical protein
VSSHGTSNPIVARLSVQTHELIQFCSVSKEKKDKIVSILHDEVQPRLLTCDHIAKAVVSEIEGVKNQITKEGLKTQAHGRVFQVPHVIDLEETVERYLYAAKSALRDVAKLLDPFLSKQFSEARYDKIYKWCVQQFGKDDNLSKLIKEDQELWIKKLVKMRNAVEHPGGYSGHLHIHNFEVVFLAENNQPSLIEPIWHLNDEPRVSIGHDLPVYVFNALEFAEDLLVILMRKAGLPEIVDVFQIPESERNPDCPVRLIVSLREDMRT